MRIEGAIRAQFTFVICTDEPPTRGQRFEDPRGEVWTVRDIRPEQGIVLRNPPAPFPIWEVTLEARHPAYRVEAGEELMPV